MFDRYVQESQNPQNVLRTDEINYFLDHYDKIVEYNNNANILQRDWMFIMK